MCRIALIYSLRSMEKVLNHTAHDFKQLFICLSSSDNPLTMIGSRSIINHNVIDINSISYII